MNGLNLQIISVITISIGLLSFSANVPASITFQYSPNTNESAFLTVFDSSEYFINGCGVGPDYSNTTYSCIMQITAQAAGYNVKRSSSNNTQNTTDTESISDNKTVKCDSNLSCKVSSLNSH